MAARLNRALLQAGTIRRAASANVASGNKYNSSSSGANNGSKSSGSSPRYTSHIRCSTVAPLLAADKMRRYSSMNLPVRQEIIANQSAGFKSVLKAGDFPPLVPNYLLKTPEDLRNNADPSSFVSKAAKGVQPGAKISPRHKTSPLPSWRETWTKVEDWLPVPKGQEDVLRRGLGAGFRAHYGYPLEVIVDVDEMASTHGTFGSMRMEQVNRWLAEEIGRAHV